MLTLVGGVFMESRYMKRRPEVTHLQPALDLDFPPGVTADVRRKLELVMSDEI